MIRDDLEGLTVFVAVAEAKSLRAAGERLGVTGSAVSQSLQRLEERVGVPLVQRTTRSLRLTEAGERLYADLRPALEEVRAAVGAAGELGAEPRGIVRLHCSSVAETFLDKTILEGYLDRHPNVDLELFISDERLDIVASGYDGGIRLGEVIDRDMIAVPISGDLRLIVVGAPAYLARRGKPKHPRDLVDHDCITWHAAPDAAPYRWEFTEDGHEFSIALRGRVLTNNAALYVRLVRDGRGLGMVYETQEIREALARGELVAVLEKYSAPFPGFYLYYPQRRHVTAALRALVDHLRRSRRS